MGWSQSRTSSKRGTPKIAGLLLDGRRFDAIGGSVGTANSSLTSSGW